MNLTTLRTSISAMSCAAIDAARRMEAANAARPQMDVRIEDDLYAGVYTRTMIVPELPEGCRCLITGVLIRIPTLLIAQGGALLYSGEDEPRVLSGHITIKAAAGRKQVYLAQSHFRLTMIFATQAKTKAEAETEFTDEPDMLQSRQTTKAMTCQA